MAGHLKGIGAALAVLLATAAHAEPGLRLGADLPADRELFARWSFAGAWLYPVGGPRDWSQGADGAPAFRVSRNIGGPAGGNGEVRGHLGADLSNGRGGDPVRAAAHGVVVRADDGGWNGAYGAVVVIAHRAPGEPVCYSVYAHLARGSIEVKAGAAVEAGDRLGVVGRTGRASADHLHFEVRTSTSPGEPWEHARVVDPLAFVEARLPAARSDSLACTLAWAELAGLVEPGADPTQPLLRREWWRMLARLGPLPLFELPMDPHGLHMALAEAGLVAAGAPADPAAPAGPEEIAGDLERLRAAGTRLASPPLDRDRHRAACVGRFGEPEPARHVRRVMEPRFAGLSLGETCLLVADLCTTQARPVRDPRCPAS
jgi:murein DD-endopeptidase MepM/ murein hydrolase activator NlpD